MSSGPDAAPRSVTLSEEPLTVADVVAVSRHDADLLVASAITDRLARARHLVERFAAADVPVYGLTTALGAGVDTRLAPDDLAAFQLRVPEARAVGVGAPLPREAVRALMMTRAAGMAAGGSGVSTIVFQGLVAALNAGLHPVVPSLGSIGAADLAPLAAMGRALLGHGKMEFAGEILPAGEALRRAGLQPLRLGLKDGHALVVANSLSVGLACLRLADLENLLHWSFRAIALNFEAFRANVSALDERALAARPAFGQQEAAGRIRDLLLGGALMQDGQARRLQDPLSFRCAPQVWGALLHAADEARRATEIELRSAGDNPVVLPAHDAMLSNGNFDMTAFVLSFERLAQALAHCAAATAYRTMKIMSPGLSDLPRFLSPLGPSRTAFATVQKTVSALEAEIRHLALPVSFAPIPVADGVEDQASMAPSVLQKLDAILERLRYLVAIELIAAAQAIELRNVGDALAEGTAQAYAFVRRHVAPLEEDRAQGGDFEALAAQIGSGAR